LATAEEKRQLGRRLPTLVDWKLCYSFCGETQKSFSRRHSLDQHRFDEDMPADISTTVD